MSTAGTEILAASAPAREFSTPRFTTVVVIAALAAGVVFRLIYPGMIEYHSDEQFSFQHVISALAGGPWPQVGMTMSIGGPNPGMSVWIFILLGWLGHVQSPVGLAECVQVLNVVALLGFVVFVVRAIPRREREPWLWAAALWAVNPLEIIYERKIWPPSTLPAFIVVMLAGWWYRRTWLGSFVFAFVSVLGGQIHPTCAFLGISLGVWSVADDRRSFRYGALAAGAVVGFLPAVSWVAAYTSAPNSLHHFRLPSPNFYGRWFTTPFGYGPDHVLGRVELPRFLGWPNVYGSPSWFVLVVYVAIAVAALALVVPAVRRLFAERRSLRWYLLGGSPAGLAVRAAGIGFGLILTVLSAAGGGLYPHYMIVIAPLMTLWVALLAAFADGGALRDNGRRILATLCVLDAVIVVLLFSFIHTVGDIRGEFGPSWEYQQSQFAGEPWNGG